MTDKHIEEARKLADYPDRVSEIAAAISEARLAGRIAGLEEAARIADDMPLVRHVTENLGGLPPLLLCNTPKDVSSAIRAAMEPKP